MNSSMNTIDLEVRSDEFNFSCTLKRRITIIRGDSGTGKTSLVKRLTITAPGITVSAPLDIKVANNSTWDAPLIGYKNAIIFYGDLAATETLEFASLCRDMLVKNNLYVVIINREDLSNFSRLEENYKGHKYMDASISVNEIYDFKNDGGINHWLEPVELPVTKDYNNVDCILVEDSGNGA